MIEAPLRSIQGHPRVGPELNSTSNVDRLYDAAKEMSLNLYPWQRYASKILTATTHNGISARWKYREVAIICARQNGKTMILKPRIIEGLRRGERILHAAQVRSLPRKTLMEVAMHIPDAVTVRKANGQEQIVSREGGTYSVVAQQRGSRGESADLLIIDELREMEDYDFIAAAEPTLANSSNPQVLYLSNAGTEFSVVLNDLKARAEEDPNLAYMEWSSAPEREVDDRDGWLEANPSIGFSNLTIERLDALYDRYRRAGELAVFETEHLCRWVKSMLPRLVADAVFQSAREALEPVLRPALGISVHPSGRRASAVLSWAQSDGSVGMRVEADVTGDPIDVPRFATDLLERLRGMGEMPVGYDSWTDQHLARHFENAEAIIGPAFSNASERFVRSLETGALKWEHADAIAEQLPYASRKDTSGNAWAAHPVDPQRPITAVLAAIRSTWLAANPQVLIPRVY